MSEPLTSLDVCRTTRSNQFRLKGVIDTAQKLAADPHKAHRLARHECALCFYSGSAAGQAFTRYTCRICKQEHQHPNTAVPEVCGACAEANGLCGQCGGQIDLSQELGPCPDATPLQPGPA